MKHPFRFFICTGLILSSTTLFADPWKMRLDLGGLYGSYSNSELRDSVIGADLFFAADYFDQYGFTLGQNHSVVTATRLSQDISQQGWFASGRQHFYPTSLPGIVTARLDGYLTNSETTFSATTLQQQVQTLMPSIQFADYTGRYLLDLGFAYSSYENGLSVSQWTPTLAWEMNHKADWLQVRGYLLDYSDSSTAQGRSSAQAVELKWSHWFHSAKGLLPDRVQLNKVFGERLYSVDPDVAAVYTLTDTDRGPLSLSALWYVGTQWQVLLAAGVQNSTNNEINNAYRNNYLYTDLAYVW
ncbi:MAG: hypothetical protein Q9N68_13340 [Gammaproteobacteria bacterium]|nr:hypothetical protein [Gammaproteobacteria bacterium]